MQRDGFTFIETLITMGILLMLTSILLLYNRSGERQIVLFKEKAGVVGLILKAKSLSLNTLIIDEPICGYGVHFENNSYILFPNTRYYGSSAGKSVNFIQYLKFLKGVSKNSIL